jgi:hypothetical protein
LSLLGFQDLFVRSMLDAMQYMSAVLSFGWQINEKIVLYAIYSIFWKWCQLFACAPFNPTFWNNFTDNLSNISSPQKWGGKKMCRIFILKPISPVFVFTWLRVSSALGQADQPDQQERMRQKKRILILIHSFHSQHITAEFLTKKKEKTFFRLEFIFFCRDTKMKKWAPKMVSHQKHETKKNPIKLFFSRSFCLVQGDVTHFLALWPGYAWQIELNIFFSSHFYNSFLLSTYEMIFDIWYLCCNMKKVSTRLLDASIFFLSFFPNLLN